LQKRTLYEFNATVASIHYPPALSKMILLSC